MATEASYTSRRKGLKDVALVSAGELAGLGETYLLRSPRNAKRLLTALRRAVDLGKQTRDCRSVKAEEPVRQEPSKE
jgi:antitoxin YefM